MPARTAIDQANRLLGPFADNWGMPQVRLDDHGRCTLRCDAGFDLRLELSDDGRVLYLIAGICDLPQSPARALPFYQQLLHWNLVDTELGGATYAIEPACGAVLLLARGDMARLDGDAAERLLSNFLEAARHACEWTEGLQREAAVPLAQAVGLDALAMRA